MYNKKQLEKWLGKSIYAVKKDKTVVRGKLVKIKGTQLIIAQDRGKKVKTKALVPLALFDLLAIGAGPYGYGGYGGFGGFGYPGPIW